jgi:hypothetical protein
MTTPSNKNRRRAAAIEPVRGLDLRQLGPGFLGFWALYFKDSRQGRTRGPDFILYGA